MKTSEQLCKRELVANVKADNYRDKARAFMKAEAISNGTERWGFTLSIRKQRSQWGAWQAYFRKKKISHRFMNDRAREDFFTRSEDEKGYQVPAEWPHQFDAEQDEYADIAAGDNFAAAVLRWDRRPSNLTQEQRQQITRKALQSDASTNPNH